MLLHPRAQGSCGQKKTGPKVASASRRFRPATWPIGYECRRVFLRGSADDLAQRAPRVAGDAPGTTCSRLRSRIRPDCRSVRDTGWEPVLRSRDRPDSRSQPGTQAGMLFGESQSMTGDVSLPISGRGRAPSRLNDALARADASEIGVPALPIGGGRGPLRNVSSFPSCGSSFTI